MLSVFAGNVRLVRQLRGLSQSELGDRSDLDRTYVSGIERKLRNLGIRNIQRIAEALHVDPRLLLDPHLSKRVASSASLDELNRNTVHNKP
ncbi:MAG: helix-turn-helix transcriptional regulator [Ideonella sp.]|nr:helix-turn-helix transcriptional regulator [Ideonella sp.]